MKNLIILSFLFASRLQAAAPLKTLAEKSNWTKTGNALETKTLCRAFQKEFPGKVKCGVYGRTPENRELHYMTIGDTKTPAVWVQAGIHAGEIDGKDAVFLLLRDILRGKVKNPLKGIHLVFIPIVNLDGHERIGKWNRPNQVGPEEMGWRTTAQNYNLNRDFMKVDAPEMRDLLKLWHKVDPVLSLDLHVTNGAQFQPEVGLIIHPTTNQGYGPLHEAGKKYENFLLAKMKVRKHLALPFYPTYEIDDDPYSGFARYVSAPRFAHGYWFNNNRLGMLVEAHSWKDYANRVRTHYSTVLSSLEIARLHAGEWKKAGEAMDQEKVQGDIPLEYKRTEKSSMIDFPGYEFIKKKSLVSGGTVIHYNPSVPRNWKVPFYEELIPKLSVSAPMEGYFIQPSDFDWLLPKLKVHGIKIIPWTKNLELSVKVFRATKTQLSAVSFEGRQTMLVEGEWREELVKLPTGSRFIPIFQPKGRLILQLMEPLAQDSFLAWGFFNKSFERKEYMENYVAEDVALEMLKQAEIKKDFEEKLKNDVEFEKSPEKRFEYFYKKHASWDERLNKYPVYKN